MASLTQNLYGSPAKGRVAGQI